MLIDHAPQQTSMNGLGTERSPFAAAFSEVLSGQDRDAMAEDREIYLDELLDQVQAACQTASGGTQSPQLFPGMSTAADPSRVLVRRLPPPGGEPQAASVDEAAAAKPAGSEEQPAASAGPTADSSTPGSGSNTAAPLENDAAGNVALAVTSTQSSSGEGGDGGSEPTNPEAPAAASGPPAEVAAATADAARAPPSRL